LFTFAIVPDREDQTGVNPCPHSSFAFAIVPDRGIKWAAIRGRTFHMNRDSMGGLACCAGYGRSGKVAGCA
jgi:hypothetical protein